MMTELPPSSFFKEGFGSDSLLGTKGCREYFLEKFEPINKKQLQKA
jgi:hypothetical protein